MLRPIQYHDSMPTVKPQYIMWWLRYALTNRLHVTNSPSGQLCNMTITLRGSVANIDRIRQSHTCRTHICIRQVKCWPKPILGYRQMHRFLLETSYFSTKETPPPPTDTVGQSLGISFFIGVSQPSNAQGIIRTCTDFLHMLPKFMVLQQRSHASFIVLPHRETSACPILLMLIATV